MPPRRFKPEEANAALAEVRPLAEELVGHRRTYVRAQRQQAELARVGAARCVNRIHGLGAIVKDLDEGLVDFPASHTGEEVLLCWKVGEDAVAFWHGLDEGFAGRKPLPFE